MATIAYDPERKLVWMLSKHGNVNFRIPSKDVSYADLSKATPMEWDVWWPKYDKWNHSGCQSGCIRRGDPKCVW